MNPSLEGAERALIRSSWKRWRGWGVGSKAPPLRRRHPGVSGNPSPARTRSPLLRGKFVFKRYHLCEALPGRKAARQTRELSHRLGILSPRGWQPRHLQKSERLRRRVRSALARRGDCSPHILLPGRLRGGRRLPSLLGVPPVLSRSPPRPRRSAPASLRPRIPWRAQRFSRLPTLSAGFLRRPARVTRADRPRPRSPPPYESLLPLLGHRARVSLPRRPPRFRWKPGPPCRLAYPCSQPHSQPGEVESALKLSVAGAGGLGMLRSQAWLWSQVGSFRTREAAATLGKVDRRGEEAPRRGAAAGRSPRQPGGAWAPCGIYSTRSRRRSRS